MYECPNCGGNLRFDIPQQQLHCDYCGTSMDPYSYEKDKDAVESDVFDATIYTCPQCGGEIMTTNVSATGFCTYCGASTVLDSRIRGEKKPKWIIPFRKTKEDCKKSFASMMRRSLYAPKELKSSAYLENFRGIYMPYWMYDVKASGIRNLPGSTSRREGDYIVTRHYSLSCDLDAPYTGVSFDASSSLDDALSESIAPFDAGDAKPFAPSFLCGFYADTADVPASVYREDALELVADDAAERVSRQVFPDRGARIPDEPENVLKYTMAEPAYGMFPVWFLTYRHRDRVAYAIMNGQTGKITSDLPIVPWKYLAGSLLLSVPIFFLLNMALTVTAPTALLLTAIPAILAGHACLAEIRTQLDVESHAGDKGYHAAIREAKKTESFVDTLDFSGAADGEAAETAGSFGETRSAASGAADGEAAKTAGTFGETGSDANAMAQGGGNGGAANAMAQDGDAVSASGAMAQGGGSKNKKAHKKKSQTKGTAKNAPKTGTGTRKKGKKRGIGEFLSDYWMILLFVLIVGYNYFGELTALFSIGILPAILTLAAILAGILLTIRGRRLQRDHREEDPRVFPGLIGSIAALVLTVLVTILHPVSDLYFYAASAASILCTGFTLASVIRRYNRMATRPLPDFFNRKGGDIHA